MHNMHAVARRWPVSHHPGEDLARYIEMATMAEVLRTIFATSMVVPRKGNVEPGDLGNSK